MQLSSRVSVPEYAVDYPKRATQMFHLNLPFYCINCQRKGETSYITLNFGPFCDECLRELA